MSKLDLTNLATGGITPSYVSIDIAAALMRVSHWTIRRWITTGALPARKTVRYRNIGKNPRASVVVDDLASTDPWTPRGIKVYGSAVIEDDTAGQRFRITPEVIWSWGINDAVAGIPSIQRRNVGPDND